MSIDARAARFERQQRIKRLLLIGTAGSLLLFFGLISAQEITQREAATSMVSVQDQSQDEPAIVAPAPRIRTRTS